MNVSKKISEIVQAVKSGVPKSRISEAPGCKKINKLLKGKKIKDVDVDRMYENLLSYRQLPQRYSHLKQYKNYLPQISKEAKIEEIKKAANGGISRLQIDPQGYGHSAKRLLLGESVTLAKINQMYANVLTLSTSKTKAKTKKKQKQKVSKPIARKKTKQDLLKIVNEQEKQIAHLVNRLSFIENTLSELKKKIEEKETIKQPEKVLGITITQKDDHVKGKKYKRWYGIVRKNGKRHFVYIGKDKSKAEIKLQAWFEKNKEATQ